MTQERSAVAQEDEPSGDLRPPRLRDIARELELSVATVSRALNGYPHVDSHTRRRVFSAAKRLGYQPNHLARALRSERTMLVGLVVPDIHSDFFATMAAVLQRELEASGYRVILCISRDDPDVDRQYLLDLFRHRVDGIVHVPCTADGARFVREMNTTLPIIEVNRHSRCRLFDTFTADDREGARELGAHLSDLGHERVAMIAGPRAISTTVDRVAGFRDAFPRARPTIIYGPHSQQAGHDALVSVMTSSEPPTAIFASSNQLVAGALLAAEELGIAIPADISLVGFDEVYWYTISRPPLTTYALPIDELAVLAAHRLVARMEGRERVAPPKPSHARLRGHLIVRGSAAPLKREVSARSSRSQARPLQQQRNRSSGSGRGR
jgi:LacI family transcriptional regulator, galactose operon repressor